MGKTGKARVSAAEKRPWKVGIVEGPKTEEEKAIEAADEALEEEG